MKKLPTILAAVLFSSVIITSCGGEKNDSETKKETKVDVSQDCTASTQEDLEVCYSDKPISDLVNFYCKWAKIEADSKDKNDKQKIHEADNHTDAIQKIVRKRAESEKDEFRKLTKDCKERN